MKECRLENKVKVEKAIKTVFGSYVPNNKVLLKLGNTVYAAKHWVISR